MDYGFNLTQDPRNYGGDDPYSGKNLNSFGNNFF